VARILLFEILTPECKSIFFVKSVAVRSRNAGLIWIFVRTDSNENWRLKKGSSKLNIKKGANAMNSSAIRKKALECTKARLVRGILILFLLILWPGMAHSTPSTTYWTPMTLDIQSFGVVHLGVDNYFSNSSAFPTDFGVTVGVIPGDKLQMEVGIDFFANTYKPDFAIENQHPVSFNAKIGYLEDSLCKNAPALEIGIFDAGFRSSVQATDFTNAEIVYGVIGKSICNLGRFSVGPYFGLPQAMRSSTGDLQNVGGMVAWDYGFCKVKDSCGNEYNKFVLCADYASGNNLLGGGGPGLYYYFTKDIDVLTGPVFFNDPAINGRWKWTVQFDWNLPALCK